MTTKILFIGFVIGLLSTAQAVDNGFLRGVGESVEEEVEQFTCTLQGGHDQGTCDSTKSEDGSDCVWCSVSSYGVCVSEDIAVQMKSKIPAITCDDDTKNDDDDDSTSADDDKAPAPTDDDAAPSDDTVPSDYWKCLTKYKTSGECTTDGCAWCDTKGGYGICMDEKAAENALNSDWFTCTMPSSLEDVAVVVKVEKNISDPNDPSCLVATMSGDGSTCKSTMDADGNPCEWCSISSYNFCLNVDQAQTVEQFGVSCGDDVVDNNNVDDEDLSDPNDPSCLVATMSGDGSSCKSTMDADGKPCEWCSFSSYNFCLNDDQAQIMEQYGVSCGDDVVDVVDNNVVHDKDLSDPNDPSCLVATMSGDQSTCKSTMDADGNSCEWCSISSYNFCLNADQAQTVEQYGVSCGDDVVVDEDISDPNDPSCLVATMSGDESSCKSTMDADGNSCEWCSFSSYNFCLNVDQAQIVEQYGVSCNDRGDIENSNDSITTSIY